MTDYAAVLESIRPGAKWSLDGDDYAGLTWLDDTAKPTKKTLDDAWPQVHYERDLTAVQAARRTRYQTESDGIYFDAMRGDGNLDGWNAAVAAIKADLPNPPAPE